jgi:ion channel-forming bestrophin family protein
MHVGRSYRIPEFLVWTREDIYVLVALGLVPVVLYQVAGLKWLGIPLAAVVLLGTATAFIVGFKNIQTYNRTWEARQIWGDIAGHSRAWGTMSRDFVRDAAKARTLVYRHLAWLIALRHYLRGPRTWETLGKRNNAEYRKHYSVPEHETALEVELAEYLPDEELRRVLSTHSLATQIIALQSATIRQMYAGEEIVVLQFVDMQKSVRDLHLHQARSERIKDFPFPRQFATVSAMFVDLFCVLLPFGLLREFDKLNDAVDGLMKGHMVWLVLPVSVVVSWMYTSLQQVGESTENPFEGGANDVPISQLCRSLEIDLREMLGEADLPAPLEPRNNIVL